LGKAGHSSGTERLTTEEEVSNDRLAEVSDLWVVRVKNAGLGWWLRPRRKSPPELHFCPARVPCVSWKLNATRLHAILFTRTHLPERHFVGLTELEVHPPHCI
jgi:hypothetical protein